MKDEQPLELTIPLLGRHQVENAAAAYGALVTARAGGLQISDAAIQAGFSQVHWPGRFEILRQAPPVVVDAAHNRDSALRLRQALDDYFPGKPVILLFGASEDKDIQGMFSELLPRVSQVIATQSVHPRAIDPAVLADLAHQLGSSALVISRVEDAFEKALQLAGEDQVLLATGSIFIAAAVREEWFKRSALRQKQLLKPVPEIVQKK
jgi:dihydrofolate synthase/folylpolyglutamate synthase